MEAATAAEAEMGSVIVPHALRMLATVRFGDLLRREKFERLEALFRIVAHENFALGGDAIFWINSDIEHAGWSGCDQRVFYV